MHDCVVARARSWPRSWQSSADVVVPALYGAADGCRGHCGRAPSRRVAAVVGPPAKPPSAWLLTGNGYCPTYLSPQLIST